MTAALDQNYQTISRLIDCCCEARDGYRSASEAVQNSGLKRLFGIYAQQRGRFAEELRNLAGTSFEHPSSEAACELLFSTDGELVDQCLARERSTLALYRKALADRNLPTKAHFLVSAQLALLERVHNRIEGLSPQANATIGLPERVNV